MPSSVSSSLIATQSAASTASQNIQSSQLVGAKAAKSIFSLTTASGSGRNTATISHQSIIRVSQSGQVKLNGISTNFAITGHGLVPVRGQTRSGEIFYAKQADFAFDCDGNLTNSNGFSLKAWRLDDQGRIPGAPGNANSISNNSFESLSDVDLYQFTGRAIATSKVKFNAILDATQAKLKGAGQTLSLKALTGGVNENTQLNDVIIPGKTNNGTLQIGDQISIKVGDNGAVNTYTYGGICISNAIDKGAGLFGATAIDAKFVAGAHLALHHGITVTINNLSTTLTYVGAGDPNATSGKFNTLENFKAALNAIPGIAADIHNNQLYVAPKNGTSAVTFTNANATDFKGVLGLSNIVAGANRFSTLQSLKDQLQSQVDLNITTNNTAINIHATSATESITFDGVTNRINTINAATVTSLPVTEASSTRGLNTLTIKQNGHGLNKGDYINLSGFTADGGAFAAVPDGIYYVTGITADGFNIAVRTPTLLVPGNTATAIQAGTTATWQKTFGNPGNTMKLTDVNLALVGTTLTIADPTLTAGNLAVEDMIYLSGLGDTYYGNATGAIVPDGYYRVTNVTPGTSFAITLVGTAPAPRGDHVARNTGRTIEYTKVGSNSLPPTAAVEGKIVRTQVAQLTNNSKYVRIYMPNHNLSPSDYFKLQDLTVSPVTINNIVFANNQRLQVSSVGDDWFEYEADTVADVIAPATGHLSTVDLAGVRIDYSSSLLKALNFSQDKNLFNPSYHADGGTAGDNIASGSIQENAWTQSFTVTDSLGVSHNFTVGFVKLDNNKWAVEVYNTKNANESFDIVSPNVYGQVASGTISFNGDGTIADITNGLDQTISIVWANDSLTSKVTIDWGKIVDTDNKSNNTVKGVRQLKGANSFQATDDGSAVSQLSSITITKAGIIIAKFINGQSYNMYQIPLVYFPNEDGLELQSGNVYSQTGDSGKGILKMPGEDGMGIITGGAVELSTAENTEQLNDIIIYSTLNSYLSSVNKKTNDMEDRFISQQ